MNSWWRGRWTSCRTSPEHLWRPPCVYIWREREDFFVWDGFCKRTIKSSMHFMPCMWSCSATTQLRDKVNVHWISFCIDLFVVHKYQSFLIRAASKNACHTCHVIPFFLVTAIVTIGCWTIPLLSEEHTTFYSFWFTAIMLEEMVKICEPQLTPTPAPTPCFNVWRNSHC